MDLLELLKQKRGLMAMLPDLIPSAQAAEFVANRGPTSMVAAPAYIGQQSAVTGDSSKAGYQAAWQEANAMGPPPTWGNLNPAQMAQKMARFQQLKQIIKQGR